MPANKSISNPSAELTPEPAASCPPGAHSHSRRRPNVGPQAIERASNLFRAMGEPSRLRILALLAQGEACVSELAQSENEDLSAVSQRLRILRTEGLVIRRRNGKHILYALSDQHVADLVFNALAHASEVPAHASEIPAHASAAAASLTGDSLAHDVDTPDADPTKNHPAA